MENLKAHGLIGCLNDTGITSENYKAHLDPERSKREDSTEEFSKEFMDRQIEISLICMLYG